MVLQDNFTPALYNDPALTRHLRGVLKSALGESRILEVQPVMGGEDFSEVGRTPEKVPLLDLWIGSVEPSRLAAIKAAGKTPPSLHSGQFAPDPEATLETGVHAMAACVLELLGR